MKIAIEAQRIFRKKKHGMDFVVLEMIRELQRLDYLNEYFVFVAPGEDRCLFESVNLKIIEIKCSVYPLWEQLFLPMNILKLSPDILHCTSNTAPLFIFGVPLVLTIHDIIYLEPLTEKNSSWYQNLGRLYRRLVVPKNVQKAATIITVSQYEKNCIKSYFPEKENTIEVVYNGYSSHFKVKKDYSKTVSKYTKHDGYLFFLGNTDPKKNVRNTLKAYSIYLKESLKKTPMLIADIDIKELDRILKIEDIEDIREYIVLLGYIPNVDLCDIYNGAKVFLYTSKRESFGIPILEAMSSGVPVITSNVSAMPEIAYQSETLVDPESPQEIANMLIKLESLPTFYKKQVRYGIKRAKEFSWANTAYEVYNIYKKVYSKRKIKKSY